MKLVLKNVGMLSHAEIDIQSLTVLAGENDNGKSTVGKVMFCLIKAIARYKEDLQESKEYRFNEQMERLFFNLRRVYFSDEYEHNIPETLIRALMDTEQSDEQRLDIAHNIIQILGTHPVVLATEPELADQLQQQFRRLNTILDEPDNIQRSIQNALRKVFASEFDTSVLLAGTTQGEIKLYEADLLLLHIDITQEAGLQVVGTVELIELKDATFIESPLILNNHDLLIRSQTGLGVSKGRGLRLGIPYTTLHTKDLFDKLVASPLINFHTGPFAAEEDLSDSIQKLLNGEVVYDPTKKNFFFRKNNNDISIKNTASGIKLFGLLKILMSNGFINSRSLLIFDEPENHLHPKWQLRFAEIVVTLARMGVRVMLSSHSPYMIEALKRFAEKDKFGKKAVFYLAENGRVANQDRLEEIFNLLTEPFSEFQKMDQDALSDE